MNKRMGGSLDITNQYLDFEAKNGKFTQRFMYFDTEYRSCKSYIKSQELLQRPQTEVRPMKTLTFVLFSLLFCSSSFAAMQTASLRSPEGNYAKKVESREIISNFMQAVDDGEISVFGEILSRDMIVPIRISHEYEISKNKVSIQIYSKLAEPIVVPENNQFSIMAISVFINPHGEIDLIKAHVKPH